MPGSSSTLSKTPSRKGMRKGTHSCLECRRRKTRCIFRPENPTTCVECFSRRVDCREQKHGDSEPPAVDGLLKPNLRERVSRLENLMEPMLLVTNPKLDTCKGLERGAAEALSNLQSDASPPASTLSASLVTCYKEDAPLLSLFDNAVLSRDSHQGAHTGDNDATQQAFGETPFNHIRFNEKAKAKRNRVRSALLSLLPSRSDLQTILIASSTWWTTWRRLFPEIGADADTKNLQQIVFSALDQDNPVPIAIAVLCIAISVRQLPPANDDNSFNLPLPSKDLMDHSLTTVDRLIISDNEYAVSVEGIELIILQAKIYDNLCQPRNGWLLFRRAISFAQLMGLHPNRKLLADGSSTSMQRRERLWWLLFEVDRYMSLLLGLPYGMADNQIINDASEDHTSPTVVYRRRLAVIIGYVINRNQVSTCPSLSTTLETDQQLDDSAKAMPHDWWDVSSARLAGNINVEESFERLATQVWYYQIKAFLHLPFMLQSATNRRFEYSRLACLDASRDLVKLYHALRVRDGGAFFMCKIFDFQGFTAAILLLLGLLGYGRMSSVQDLQQEQNDWHLIDVTINILRQASSDEPTNTMAAQGIQVLETLCAARHDTRTSNGELKLKRNAKLVVPYFGTITISPGSIFTISKTSNSHSEIDTQSPSLTDVVPPSIAVPHEASLRGHRNYFQELNFDADSSETFGLPHIDIDWQAMVNMDLDQDWNWFLDGAEN